MSREDAKKFFDQLDNDQQLQDKIKLGLESLTKIASNHDVTKEELSQELQDRWKKGENIIYSEPPGF
jgi:lambda repressor-like predicted transcriptional regulator